MVKNKNKSAESTYSQNAIRLLTLPLLLIAIATIITVIVALSSDPPAEPDLVTIHGVVTDIKSKPNLSENGSLHFIVKGDDGREYDVDATGNMNRPGAPMGVECIDVPNVLVGDKVEFRLGPKGKALVRHMRQRRCDGALFCCTIAPLNKPKSHQYQDGSGNNER